MNIQRLRASYMLVACQLHASYMLVAFDVGVSYMRVTCDLHSSYVQFIYVLHVKNQMRGQHYETNEALQTAVCHCLWAAGTEFYRKGIFKLPERWEKCVQRNEDYVEK